MNTSGSDWLHVEGHLIDAGQQLRHPLAEDGQPIAARLIQLGQCSLFWFCRKTYPQTSTLKHAQNRIKPSFIGGNLSKRIGNSVQLGKLVAKTS